MDTLEDRNLHILDREDRCMVGHWNNYHYNLTATYKAVLASMSSQFKTHSYQEWLQWLSHDSQVDQHLEKSKSKHLQESKSKPAVFDISKYVMTWTENQNV